MLSEQDIKLLGRDIKCCNDLIILSEQCIKLFGRDIKSCARDIMLFERDIMLFGRDIKLSEQFNYVVRTRYFVDRTRY